MKRKILIRNKTPKRYEDIPKIKYEEFDQLSSPKSQVSYNKVKKD